MEEIAIAIGKLVFVIWVGLIVKWVGEGIMGIAYLLLKMIK